MNMSDMDLSQPKRSNLVKNDTRELLKKQTKGSYSCRLFSKLRNTPTPPKPAIKASFYQKYITKPKRNPAERCATPPKPKEKANQWIKEYDIWNMLLQAFEGKCKGNSRLQFSKDIGVRDSNDQIRLIQNRDELDAQVLVDSNGLLTQVRDLINPNESEANVSMKIKFKLVPVVERIILVTNTVESEYKFANQTEDINNNDIKYEKTVKEGNVSKPVAETMAPSDIHIYEEIDDINLDKTITNKPSKMEYTNFCENLTTDASSTFISSEDKENLTYPPLVVSRQRLVFICMDLFF